MTKREDDSRSLTEYLRKCFPHRTVRMSCPRPLRRRRVLRPGELAQTPLSSLGRKVAYSYKWNCLFNARSVSVRFLTFGVVTPLNAKMASVGKCRPGCLATRV